MTVFLLIYYQTCEHAIKRANLSLSVFHLSDTRSLLIPLHDYTFALSLSAIFDDFSSTPCFTAEKVLEMMFSTMAMPIYYRLLQTLCVLYDCLFTNVSLAF